MTCKNASNVIGYALRSIAKLKYPKDKIYIIIVDGGSTDGTADIAKKILDSYGLRYEITVKPCNIPEGRNECIIRAIKKCVDYILFIDSDITIANKQILLKLIDFDINNGPCVVSAKTMFKTFTNLNDLVQFANSIVDLDEDKCELNIKAKPVPWCEMSLTLIPAEIANRIKFDSDMTFSEDRLFGYHVWKNEYKVYSISSDKPLAYDINIIKRSDIYVRMSIREYFRGLYKKALVIAYTYYSGSFFKTSLNFLKSTVGKRMLFHVLNSFTLLVGLLLLLTNITINFGLILIGMHGVLSLLYIVKLRLTKCESWLNALANLIKFTLFSQYTTLLIPIIVFKHKNEFNKLFNRRAKYKICFQ